MAAKRELGRGERVIPGLWRLRLPLPFPGIPHCNAWAIAAGSGVVLVDTGMYESDSMAQLERAMEQVNLRLEHVRLVVITHAHVDHFGQSATICDRAGCALWMHPRYEHGAAPASDPGLALEHRLEIGRQSGVPEPVLQRYISEREDRGTGIARVVPPDRELLNGVTIDTDLGIWHVYETPGHAPSHVCLYQPERRLLISGDHVLGRISLYYDFGWTPDPVAEYLRSLDVVAGLDARLGLSGHGRPFVDVEGHISASRALVQRRLDAVRGAVGGAAGGEPARAVEIAPHVRDGERLSAANAPWMLAETLCYLHHLEREGEVRREEGERWIQATG